LPTPLLATAGGDIFKARPFVQEQSLNVWRGSALQSAPLFDRDQHGFRNAPPRDYLRAQAQSCLEKFAEPGFGVLQLPRTCTIFFHVFLL
jgi:hypothetical protein